jgi:serine/threonine protein kinase
MPVHRDVKLKNILLGADGKMKIIELACLKWTIFASKQAHAQSPLGVNFHSPFIFFTVPFLTKPG